MKKLLGILVVGLLVITAPSFAGSIRDFQIEGMSIGDNLLDFFSEEEIEKRDLFYYPNSNKFVGISFRKQSFYKTYDEVQFTITLKDKKIYNIGGRLDFDKDIEGCNKKKDEITEELSATLKGDVVIRDAGTFKHTYDKSGKSTVSAIYFEFKNNRGSIKVQCYDWDDNMPYSDILMVTIDTEEYRNFLKYEAY